MGRACAMRFLGTGSLAVLEHDDLAVMADVHNTPREKAGGVWQAALHALAASALAYLESGLAVLAIVNYGRERRKLLEHLLEPAPVRQVVVLPPWELNRAWTVERIHAANPPEGQHIGWAAHQRFYDDLVAMAGDGMFDAVINPAQLDLDEMVDLLARQLGLAASHWRSSPE